MLVHSSGASHDRILRRRTGQIVNQSKCIKLTNSNGELNIELRLADEQENVLVQ